MHEIGEYPENLKILVILIQTEIGQPCSIRQVDTLRRPLHNWGKRHQEF